MNHAEAVGAAQPDAHLESSTVQGGAFDLGALLAGLSAKAKEMGARRIVFDGVDMLVSRLDDPAAERSELHRLHQCLYESGLSGILTAKTKRSDPSLSPRYEFLQYLADCVIFLQHRVTSTIASRHLQILKYRGGAAGRTAEIEIVDVLREPMRGLEDGIILSPTLVRLSPLPVRRVVGNLSNHEAVLLALGVTP